MGLRVPLGKYFGAHHFSESFFHIFVPQTIDQGVQHGDHYSVEHHGHFVNARAVARLAPAINEKDCSVKDDDGSEVGSTGGKALHLLSTEGILRMMRINK